MFSALYRSIIITSLLALLVCGLYPLAVTEIGHLFFSKKANGNLLLKNEQIIGAKLIGI